MLKKIGTNLIGASKLEVTVQVLLVQRLKSRVQQSTKQGTRNLLHNLRSSLFRVVLRNGRAQSVIIHVVGFGELVRGADDELETVDWNGERFEYGFEEEGVVRYAVFDELDGGF